MTREKRQAINFKDSLVRAVNYMDVRRTMVIIVHLDEYSVEPTDRWHGRMRIVPFTPL